MKILKSNWMYVLGGLTGAVAGYLYWRFIGCVSGTCPITSSPIISSIYGLMVGVLIGGLFKKQRK